MYKILNMCVALKGYSINDDKWELFKCDIDEWNKCKEKIFLTYLSELENSFYRNLEIYRDLKKGDILVKNDIDIMIVNDKWSKARIFPAHQKENILTFILQLFYSKAVCRGSIQVHSALISYNGSGIVFIGPSGIGKTTQAELWNKYKEALIINGDMVFVQETETDFLGWGTPWHGSSPYCENTSVPLKAMIVLKQAPENSIRELTGFEKVSAVSNNVFYPTWLENGMELCLETLDHLLSRIPVYELSCRPDEEAVKLTEETIFGSGSVSD